MMAFHPDAFVSGLRYMGLGMLGIFVVIGVLLLSVYALRRLIKK